MSTDNNLKPKNILVLLSSFNGGSYIKEQIDSILNQETRHNIHLRIRDDGSSDDTLRIIRDFQKRFPDKIELIKGDNLGFNGSFFALLDTASGYDYYSLSDQDDIWLPDKLQIACDMIDSADFAMPVLYASTSTLIHDDKIPYGITRKKKREMALYNTIVQNICPGHTIVINDALVRLIKNVDSSRIYAFDAWIENVANIYGRIIFDNTPHTLYRQYGYNKMGAASGKFSKLRLSTKRALRNEGLSYRRQIEYFVNQYQDILTEKGYYDELKRFLNAKSTLERIRYALTGKIYRQSKLETIALRIAIILGKF